MLDKHKEVRFIGFLAGKNECPIRKLLSKINEDRKKFIKNF